MPILVENRHRYPGGSPNSPEWKALVEEVRERSGDVCEGMPGIDPDCRAVNGQRHPITGSKVVLTVAHLNHKPEDCRPENLRHACQRCHNRYDAPHRAATHRRRRGQLALFTQLEAPP